jgi:hypothetical protein
VTKIPIENRLYIIIVGRDIRKDVKEFRLHFPSQSCRGQKR